MGHLPYVWAVNHDRVLDASLGYFITPRVKVLLGHAVLHERPRPAQWAAVALAAAGALWLALGAGHVPWVSLVLALALSFGFFGLLRKTAPLGAIKGLALETLLLAPLAVGGLLSPRLADGHAPSARQAVRGSSTGWPLQPAHATGRPAWPGFRAPCGPCHFCRS